MTVADFDRWLREQEKTAYRLRMTEAEFWDSNPATLGLMLEADGDRINQERLRDATAATWHELAVNHAIALSLGGGSGKMLEPWDFVPDLMPDWLKKQREERDEALDAAKFDMVTGWINKRNRDAERGH